MKKIMAAIVFVMVMLPVTNALANTPTNMMFGTSMNFGSTLWTSEGTTLEMTDENTSGGFTFQPYQFAWYEFSEAKVVTSHELSIFGGSTTSWVIRLYDSSKNLLYTSSTYTQTLTQPMTGVKYVSVQNNRSAVADVKNMQVFGYTDTNVPPEPIVYSPVTNLTAVPTYNSVFLDWENPTGSTHATTKIIQNGVEVANISKTSSSYTVNSLVPETSYTFNVIAMYDDGTSSTAETVTLTTEPMPPDTEPPPNITSVTHVKTDTVISFLYNLPVDSDFSHLKIYRDGDLVESFYTDSSFDDFGLNGNTAYTYKFVSVDLSGNESSGYIQTITTDMTVDNVPPALPSNIVVAAGGASASIQWDASVSTDATGYNVYLDGVKHNTSLIKGTYYVISNLQNDVDYSVTVTVVDTSGNESMPSAAQIVTPKSAIMPIFKMEYTLQDVADGTAGWFGSLWLILAFSVAIPLSFLVARRVKGLLIS